MTATVPGIHLGIDTHANRPAANTVGDATLYSCSTHGLVYKSNLAGNSWATWATLGASPSGSITASGYTQNTAKILGRTTGSAGAIEEIAVSSGLLMSAGALTAAAFTIVTQELGADFVTANDSAWHDVTGMTGISLVAGTWIATVDIEHVCTANYGPVFRLTDGTIDYAQMGYIENYLATVSTHQVMTAKPFVLGSTTSLKLQVYSDTVFTIKKYPTRGGLSSIIATHILCQRVA